MRFKTICRLLICTGLSLLIVVIGVAAMQRHGGEGAFRKLEGKEAKDAGETGRHLSEETLALMALSHAKRFVYRGSEIDPSEEAGEPELDVQMDIAEAFRNGDPVPQKRRQMFRWCISNPELVCTGWYGSIRQVSPANKAWRVELVISPRLESKKGGVAFTPDYCVEEWEYSRGKLRFLDCTHPPDAKPFLMID